MKEFWKATHPDRDITLHIIQRDAKMQQWVVCHNFDGKEWDWGTYCDTLEQAIEVFIVKLAEAGYTKSADSAL